MTKPLPTNLYHVERIPPPDEKQRYDSRILRRIYHEWRHARLFMTSNPDSTFKVHVAKVDWQEVDA
jgi:hypothetical protein